MPDRQVRAGSSINLRSQFLDDLSEPASASNTYVHIFEPDVDYNDLSLAYIVSGSPTYLGQGIYNYEFNVPSSATEGTWHDYWEGDLIYQTVSGIMDFEVIKGGTSVSVSNQLYNNDLVYVTVASGLQATDGTSLSTEYEMEFMTTADPAYSTPRKVRMEVGGFISSIPDYVIQMAIVDASLEADALTFTTTQHNSNLFKHARYEYVSCVASAMMMTNVGSLLLRTKTLADLHVEYDTNGVMDAIDKLKACIETWKPQLIAGGGAKAVRAPSMVVKGWLDPDRPYVSRSWESTEAGSVTRRTPGANTRVRQSTQRRHKRTWSRPGKKYW